MRYELQSVAVSSTIVIIVHTLYELQSVTFFQAQAFHPEALVSRFR